MMRIATFALATLAAVGCKKTVDNKGFASNLEDKVRALGLHPGNVSCPSDVDAKAGAKFTCKVPIEAATYDLLVTIKSVDGSVVQMDTAWAKGPAVIRDRLRESVPRSMQDALGAEVALDCGVDPLLFLDHGKVACRLTSGRAASKLVLAFDDKLEITGWELVPPLLGKQRIEALLVQAIAEKSGASVTVNCGAEALISRPSDGVITCSVVAGKTTTQVRVTVTPDLKIENWTTVTP